MAEHKLFDGDVPHVSTAEFHAHRERAPHLEQPVHQGRLNAAFAFIIEALQVHAAVKPGTDDVTLSDLGCGDGGLLQTLRGVVGLTAYGYDFQPSNAAGWAERGVNARQADVFGTDRDRIILGDIAVTTEVLEHLADPHGAVRWIGEHSRYLIASSPWNETPESHDECHAWAWDQYGYRALIEQGGYTVLRHETVGQFQVILAEQKEATPCASS
ncbi:methyltransferase domain-containing protein [Streptomyces sp. LN704]|uniref:methyltransferase domain-containing protein n=1 Tax=Streptomyces sp. LN704 TaxID=3112982 RepID=UPI00371EEFD2